MMHHIMSTITFDTLKFADKLEKAGATREYAKAEAEAMADIFATGTQDIATRSDILANKNALQSEIALLRADMREMELRLTLRLGGMMAASIGIVAALIKLL